MVDLLVVGVMRKKGLRKYKVFSLLVVVPLSGCEADGSKAFSDWQKELLLQLDEVRQKQNLLEKEISELKAQVAAANKPDANKNTSNVPFRAPFVLGDKDAKVAILEFSDFECPYCARHAKSVLPKIKEEFIDKGVVQYGLSAYPLSFHAGAKSAAAAVRCAGEQEKYWQMYADIFEDRGKTRSQGYRPLAEKNGLDTNKFQTCLDNPLTVAAVEADVAFGERLGVDGTPRFLLRVLEDGQLKNVKLIKGARDFDTFAKVISELKGK